MTTSNNNAVTAFRALAKQEPIFGKASVDQHSMTIFVKLPTATSWHDFQRESERIRRHATMRKNILGTWSRDEGAPALNSRPRFAVCYDRQLQRFVPGVNVAVVRMSTYAMAQAEGLAAAAEANLLHERTGKMPATNDLTSCDFLIVEGMEPGTEMEGAVSDLLQRING